MRPPFYVWQERILKRLQPEDVVAISSDKNYIKIYINNGKFYMVRATLASALKSLPSDLIKRVHNSLAVSINYIDNIARDHLHIDGEETPFPISRQHSRAFINSLNIIGGKNPDKKVRKRIIRKS